MPAKVIPTNAGNGRLQLKKTYLLGWQIIHYHWLYDDMRHRFKPYLIADQPA
jgi:hypothetical protein